MRVYASLATVMLVLVSNIPALASSIILHAEYIDRTDTLARGSLIVSELSGSYASMVNQTVSLTRGTDPLSGNLVPGVPDYFTKLIATVTETRLKIYEQMSLWEMPIGTFGDPNFVRNYTGIVRALLIDDLLITGGTGAGILTIDYRITGTGGSGNPDDFVGPGICPSTTKSAGPRGECTPHSVEIDSPFEIFDQTFTYHLEFDFGVPFQLVSSLASGTFVTEPNGLPGQRYFDGATVDAFHSLEFRVTGVSDAAGNAVAAAIHADSGIDYFNPDSGLEATPEPATLTIVGLGLAFLIVRRHKFHSGV